MTGPPVVTACGRMARNAASRRSSDAANSCFTNAACAATYSRSAALTSRLGAASMARGSGRSALACHCALRHSSITARTSAGVGQKRQVRIPARSVSALNAEAGRSSTASIICEQIARRSARAGAFGSIIAGINHRSSAAPEIVSAFVKFPIAQPFHRSEHFMQPL